jgi:hypothetical protein
MLTFIGEGYTPAFTENYRGIAARLSAGEDILLVSGPDDICAPLLSGEGSPHCLGASVVERDAKSLQAVGPLIGRPMEPGSAIKPDANLLTLLRQKFASGEIGKACAGCEWESLCSRIASKGYPGILVDPARLSGGSPG